MLPNETSQGLRLSSSAGNLFVVVIVPAIQFVSDIRQRYYKNVKVHDVKICQTLFLGGY